MYPSPTDAALRYSAVEEANCEGSREINLRRSSKEHLLVFVRSLGFMLSKFIEKSKQVRNIRKITIRRVSISEYLFVYRTLPAFYRMLNELQLSFFQY